MPASMVPGCFTSSPGVDVLVDAVDAHGTRVVKATRMFSDGMSVLRWIGRCGSRIGVAMLFQRAGLRVDREGGDVMVGCGSLT